MGLDQKGTVVFHVKHDHDKGWKVIEEGFEKPIAYFTELEQAKNYAQKIADTKEGSKVIIDD